MTYKVPHAAKVLDLGVRTVWGLVHSGEIESFKVGASRLIRREALESYIQKKQREAAADPSAA